MYYSAQPRLSLLSGMPNPPEITQLEAYQTNSSWYIVGVSWKAGDENSDLAFYQVQVDGVDSAVSRVQDTKEVVVIKGAPPENVTVRVTAVSQCGQRSDPASETTSVATVSAGKELGGGGGGGGGGILSHTLVLTSTSKK